MYHLIQQRNNLEDKSGMRIKCVVIRTESETGPYNLFWKQKGEVHDEKFALVTRATQPAHPAGR